MKQVLLLEKVISLADSMYAALQADLNEDQRRLFNEALEGARWRYRTEARIAELYRLTLRSAWLRTFGAEMPERRAQP